MFSEPTTGALAAPLRSPARGAPTPRTPAAPADATGGQTMDLSLGEDQLTLRAAFAEFFDKESTVERVRAAEPLGFDQDLWTKLARTGAIGMGLPEDAGGGGASSLDLVVVAEQYGRRIAPVPFIEATAAGHVLAQAGAAELIGGVTDGSILPTIALSPARDGRLRLVPAGAVAE